MLYLVRKRGVVVQGPRAVILSADTEAHALARVYDTLGWPNSHCSVRELFGNENFVTI